MRFPSFLVCLRIVLAAAFLAFALAPGGNLHAQPAPTTPTAALEPLKIVTSSGEHSFQIEVARTDEQRARGLMFRRFMPQDRGMLFDFKAEQPVMMWMRNTYIPLDMIFIARDGRVINVAENTEPMSERTIASAAPALAVLEVNAGVARKINLKPGDRILHPLFKN
ncbi:MAG: DUF192 domain-containing protein [Beijerinckiaceae bacterium]